MKARVHERSNWSKIVFFGFMGLVILLCWMGVTNHADQSMMNIGIICLVISYLLYLSRRGNVVPKELF